MYRYHPAIRYANYQTLIIILNTVKLQIDGTLSLLLPTKKQKKRDKG